MRRHSERWVTTRVAPVACACAIVGAFAACSDDKRAPLPDWSDGYEQGGPMAVPTGGDGGVGDGGIDGGSGMPDDNAPPRNTFAIRMASEVRWPMRIRDQEALDEGRIQACYVKRDSPATELVYSDAKDVRCTIDMDELDLHQLGVQFDVIVPKGMCDFLLRVPYIYENFEIGQGPSKVSYTINADGSFSDEVNSMAGVPYCRYDYSGFGDLYPNCCYGSYTSEATSAQTGKKSVTRGNWGGGKLGKCYYGGGYLDKRVTFDTADFPVAETIYMGRDALVQHEDFLGIEGKYGPNVALANYFDPADHDDGPPAALRARFAHQDYDYWCLDDAEEPIAHIAVQVREWNEEVEFDADGDPDTVGTEPGWDGPIDDWDDWKTLTPGATDFPNLPHL